MIFECNGTSGSETQLMHSVTLVLRKISTIPFNIPVNSGCDAALSRMKPTSVTKSNVHAVVA